MADVIKCPECRAKTRPSKLLAGCVSCPACGKVSPAGGPVAQNRAGHAILADQEEVNEQIEAEVKDEFNLEAELDLPDYMEVEVGWRAWAVDVERAAYEPPVLHSITYRQHFWVPRQPLEAVCDKSTGSANGVKRKGHEVPHETCTCGLYAASSREHLLSMRYANYDADREKQFRVIGKVSLWGKVIPGSQGWRAQFSYPAELYVPFEAWSLAKPLAETYGVPVRLNNFLAA